MMNKKFLGLGLLMAFSCIRADEVQQPAQPTQEAIEEAQKQAAEAEARFVSSLSDTQKASYEEFKQQLGGAQETFYASLDKLQTGFRESISSAVKSHQEVVDLYKKFISQEELVISFACTKAFEFSDKF